MNRRNSQKKKAKATKHSGIQRRTSQAVLPPDSTKASQSSQIAASDFQATGVDPAPPPSTPPTSSTDALATDGAGLGEPSPEFYEGIGAPMQMLSALIRLGGPRRKLQRLLEELPGHDIVARPHIQARSRACGAEGGVGAVLAESLPRFKQVLGSTIGMLWVPLVVQGSADGTVVVRRLICRVKAEGEVDLVDPTTTAWRSRLETVVNVVGCSVVAALPGVDPEWIRGVQYSLSAPLSSADPLTAELATDSRSFELAAAVALLSAAFRVALPTGTAATGLIEPSGVVRRLSDGDSDMIRAKCRGLPLELPSLERLYVAADDQVPAFRELLDRCLLEICTSVAQLTDEFRTAGTGFYGRQLPPQPSRLHRVLRSVVTLGLGTREEFENYDKLRTMPAAFLSVSCFMLFVVLLAHAKMQVLARIAGPFVLELIAPLPLILLLGLVGTLRFVIGQVEEFSDRAKQAEPTLAAVIDKAPRAIYSSTVETGLSVILKRFVGVFIGLLHSGSTVTGLLSALLWGLYARYLERPISTGSAKLVRGLNQRIGDVPELGGKPLELSEDAASTNSDKWLPRVGMVVGIVEASAHHTLLEVIGAVMIILVSLDVLVASRDWRARRYQAVWVFRLLSGSFIVLLTADLALTVDGLKRMLPTPWVRLVDQLALSVGSLHPWVVSTAAFFCILAGSVWGMKITRSGVQDINISKLLLRERR